MITLNLTLPDPVAAEFYEAADELNKRFGDTRPKIDAKTLMAFALARHDSKEMCAQFDLLMRVVQTENEPPFNPLLR
jgi:hypothetical protein